MGLAIIWFLVALSFSLVVWLLYALLNLLDTGENLRDTGFLDFETVKIYPWKLMSNGDSSFAIHRKTNERSPRFDTDKHGVAYKQTEKWIQERLRKLDNEG